MPEVMMLTFSHTNLKCVHCWSMQLYARIQYRGGSLYYLVSIVHENCADSLQLVFVTLSWFLSSLVWLNNQREYKRPLLEWDWLPTHQGITHTLVVCDPVMKYVLCDHGLWKGRLDISYFHDFCLCFLLLLCCKPPFHQSYLWWYFSFR